MVLFERWPFWIFFIGLARWETTNFTSDVPAFKEIFVTLRNYKPESLSDCKKNDHNKMISLFSYLYFVVLLCPTTNKKSQSYRNNFSKISCQLASCPPFYYNFLPFRSSETCPKCLKKEYITSFSRVLSLNIVKT